MFGLFLGLLSLPTNIMKVRLNKGTRLIRTRRDAIVNNSGPKWKN